MVIKELSNEEELILEKNLVWIFAYRRSGTTWLGLELLSHETRNIDELLLGHLIGRDVFIAGGKQRLFDVQKNVDNFFLCEKYSETWKFFLRKLILNRIYAQLQDLSHKIILKEPTGSMGCDIIASCLPESRIIILMRDGRDVLDSVLDAQDSSGWETKRGLKHITKDLRLEYLKRHARTWNRLVKLLIKSFDSHSKERRILIRYEDLINQTFDEVKKIYEFLEIDIKKEELEELIKKYDFKNIPESEKGKGKFRRFATPGKWKENFTDEEKKTVENMMGDTLRKMGY